MALIFTLMPCEERGKPALLSLTLFPLSDVDMRSKIQKEIKVFGRQ